MPRELAEAIARARPRLGRLASTVLFFETIGSTNDVAGRQSSAVSRQSSVDSPRSAPSSPKRLVAGPDEGLVVIADEQTAGRGRRGHTWFSPPGSGLYVSVVLAPAASIDPLRATTLLTLAAGVALAEGIETAAGLRVDLKWPNDLQVSRRKLGGILAESSGTGGAGDSVIVGYGINVRTTAFPPELGDRATSLESELGRAVDRHQVLAETLAALSRRYEDLLAGRFDAILDAWRRLAPGATGAHVTWTTNAGTASGVTAGVDDAGALLVRVDGGVERIVSGEVVWR
ncbi:MAG: biotin/acetyl-CoA-carboxylase ligase [Acidobacteria bacterium]|nr:biotin/acetyl-CoA-carboxylase ligase [Acidobacteriota bacterium]